MKQNIYTSFWKKYGLIFTVCCEYLNTCVLTIKINKNQTIQ